MLYQCSEYAEVPFAKYAKDLTTRFLNASETSPSHVSLDYDVDKVSMPVSEAIPASATARRKLFKHAFPKAAPGTIRVKHQILPEHSVLLSVRDKGWGSLPALDLEYQSFLGVQLMTTLVEQLESNLDVICQFGSTFRVAFSREHLI